MPRRHVSRYEIVDGASREVVGRHRTRQAAPDNWRLKHTGRPVQIFRRYEDPGLDVLVVEGIWHQTTDDGDASGD